MVRRKKKEVGMRVMMEERVEVCVRVWWCKEWVEISEKGDCGRLWWRWMKKNKEEMRRSGYYGNYWREVGRVVEEAVEVTKEKKVQGRKS